MGVRGRKLLSLILIAGAALVIAPAIISAQAPGTQKWSFTTGGAIGTSPAIANDGTVYINSDDGYLYAVNPNGSQKWRFEVSGSFAQSSPVIGYDNSIYICSGFNLTELWLIAVNPNGTEKWRFALAPNEIQSPAIGPDGTIYIGTEGKFLHAINPDGTEKWKYEASSALYSSPAVGRDGTIYIGGGSSDCTLYAINPNRSMKWKSGASRGGGCGHWV